MDQRVSERNAEHGSGLVEMALTLPLVLLVSLVIIQFGVTAFAGSAARVKHLAGFALLVAQGKRLVAQRGIAQFKGQRAAFGVTGFVLCGIADGDQRLLQAATMDQIGDQRPIVGLRFDQRHDRFVPRDLGDERAIIGLDQQIAVVARQADAAVARDLLHNIGADVGRHIVLGELIGGAQHFSGL